MTRRELIAEEPFPRLDAFLSHALGESRSAVQNWIRDGRVTRDGTPQKKNTPVCVGDTFVIELPDAAPCELVAQESPLDILYEDDDLLVVNKAQGMVVHPAAGNWDGTLVNALLFHCKGRLSGINGELRPGIVHRLDKDTSGLMVVAKTDVAHRGLAAQIQAHEVRRVYHTVVVGHLRDGSGVVDAPIGRHKTDRKRMSVTQEHAREARTHYRVLCEYPGFTYVECRLETGRTHQIRVHMAYLGHPVAGDPVYGVKDRSGLSAQCLHAKELTFTHPVTGESMHFVSELPDTFSDFLQRLSAQQ